MGDKKKGKKGKKGKKDPAGHAQTPAEVTVDERRIAGYERLYIAEQRIYDLWEQRSGGEMSWVGELVGAPAEEDMTLWLAALGDKVAALGGQLELVAVFPDDTVTLLVEPGLNNSPDRSEQ